MYIYIYIYIYSICLFTPISSTESCTSPRVRFGKPTQEASRQGRGSHSQALLFSLLFYDIKLELASAWYHKDPANGL